jgi:hypothetical protein
MLKVSRAWNDKFQSLKENNCQPRQWYLANLSFTIQGEIKHHSKQLMTTAESYTQKRKMT